MFKFDYITKEIINLISHQPDIDKMYLYVKDPYKAKYQLLVNKREGANIKHSNDYKAFIEYSDDMDDIYIYKNIEEYNPNEKRKILIALENVLADMLSDKNRIPIATELFIRGRKVNIYLVFITQCYFATTKNVRLYSTLYFIIEIPNTREL